MAVFVGILSSGFSFYRMDCRRSCPTGVYFQDPHQNDSSCGTVEEKKNQQHSCCEKENDASDSETDCCNVKEIILKKDFDFASQTYEFSLQDFHLLNTPVFQEPQEFIPDTKNAVLSYRGPPDKIKHSGKDIRIHIQSLLYDFESLV